MATQDQMAEWEGESISAITHQGVSELVGKMAALVHEARQEQPFHEGVVTLRPEPEGARVERIGDHEFRLVGAARSSASSRSRHLDPRGEALHRPSDEAARRAEAPRRVPAPPTATSCTSARFSFEYQSDM
jgi:hypothetical protein